MPPGICVMNVQRALLDRGIQSDVLMVGEKEGFYSESEFGKVYSIKGNIYFVKQDAGGIRYLKRRLPMVFSWPIAFPERVDAYRKAIQALDEENHYSAVIGTLFPIDVVLACSDFRHFFLYELDSLTNNPVYKEGAKRFFYHRLVRLEKKLFQRAELIIHLNHNKKYYSKKKYAVYAGKSVYTDIPNLVEETAAGDCNPFSGSKIHIVYSGLLAKSYRSPEYAIRLIREIEKTVPVECLFFSRGDCEEMISEAEAETAGAIKQMGYVSPEELNSYICNADFLLDIGNNLTGEDVSLPSKVIGYMAAGMPVIHINGQNDSAIPYLEKYGLATNVDPNLPLKDNVASVIGFMHEKKDQRKPFADVKKLFPENCPQYTAAIIADRIMQSGDSGLRK